MLALFAYWTNTANADVKKLIATLIQKYPGMKIYTQMCDSVRSDNTLLQKNTFLRLQLCIGGSVFTKKKITKY